ncbi:MAG: glycosyltransferase [Euryarchaeota archaeon]|jgi:glycosyltransferase involved in cell wall biosynthesis|nr:glycosyltransferase [Euryarchaeota archaeon]
MEKKINLSMVIETDILYGGGTEKTILFYNKYLNRKDFNLTIFDTNIIDKKRLEPEEVKKIFDLEKTEKIYFPSILKSLLTEKKWGVSSQKRSISKDLFLLYSILLKFFSLHLFNRKKLNILKKSDIIYVVSDYQIFYLVIPLKICSRGKIKVIFGTHNYLPIERRVLNRIENKLIEKFTDSIHYTSPAIFSISKIKRKNDFIVPSGVDTEKFYPAEKKNKKICYLFVGRLVEYKGILELLEAWKIFPYKNNAELHIVGTGELESIISDYSQKLEGIKYHGFVREQDLPEIYRNCDILVFPTYGIKHDEYFGLVVIEALSSGNYVIVGEGMRGVFDYFEKEGVLEYTPLSPEEINKRMVNAYKNLEVLKERVIKMRNYIIENYDWRSISLKFSEKIRGL